LQPETNHSQRHSVHQYKQNQPIIKNLNLYQHTNNAQIKGEATNGMLPQIPKDKFLSNIK